MYKVYFICVYTFSVFRENVFSLLCFLCVLRTHPWMDVIDGSTFDRPPAAVYALLNET